MSTNIFTKEVRTRKAAEAAAKAAEVEAAKEARLQAERQRAAEAALAVVLAAAKTANSFLEGITDETLEGLDLYLSEGKTMIRSAQAERGRVISQICSIQGQVKKSFGRKRDALRLELSQKEEGLRSLDETLAAFAAAEKEFEGIFEAYKVASDAEELGLMDSALVFEGECQEAFMTWLLTGKFFLLLGKEGKKSRYASYWDYIGSVGKELVAKQLVKAAARAGDTVVSSKVVHAAFGCRDRKAA